MGEQLDADFVDRLLPNKLHQQVQGVGKAGLQDHQQQHHPNHPKQSAVVFLKQIIINGDFGNVGAQREKAAGDNGHCDRASHVPTVGTDIDNKALEQRAVKRLPQCLGFFVLCHAVIEREW
ncbi:MAG: hypothetical protein UZ07_CHB004003189 [Chlorobi bacterium OLB7]|nr:MAG: hypothetical protein UZ07_CHB004003189 [Chlorobi bacterium OLB7]